MLCNITGEVQSPEGNPVPGAEIAFTRRGTAGVAGITVIPRVVMAEADSESEVDLDLYTGTYDALVTYQRRRWAFAVVVPQEPAADLSTIIGRKPQAFANTVILNDVSELPAEQKPGVLYLVLVG